MKIIKNNFKYLYLLKKNLFKDRRGFFYRDFCQKVLRRKKINFNIKQTNISYNKDKFTLRGFHYQSGKSKEKKIMTCIKGRAVIYILNIDKKSDNYLKPLKFILSEKNKHSLLIPDTYANAYMTLEKDTMFLYYMSNYYKKSQNFGIKYNDPILKIKWPSHPRKISKKDMSFKNLIIK